MARTLMELRKERDMLRAGKMKRSKKLMKITQKQKLKSEIRELKYPKTFAALKTFKKAGARNLKNLGLGAKEALAANLKKGRDDRVKQLRKSKKCCKMKVRKLL